jgi:hypothetical protein
MMTMMTMAGTTTMMMMMMATTDKSSHPEAKREVTLVMLSETWGR